MILLQSVVPVDKDTHKAIKWFIDVICDPKEGSPIA